MVSGPALLELEADNIPAAGLLADQLATLAAKLGEGSEQPYAAAISALLALARHEHGAIAVLDRAISQLEQIDARFLVPDLHGSAAELHYRAHDLDAAHDRAAFAARVADEVARPFEAARAQALLACIAAQRGDLDRSEAHLRAVHDASDGLPGHVEGLRRKAERLLAVSRRSSREPRRGRHVAVIMVEERFDPPIDVSQGSQDQAPSTGSASVVPSALSGSLASDAMAARRRSSPAMTAPVARKTAA